LRITTNEMVAAEWASEIRQAWETGGMQMPSRYRPPSSSRTRKTTTSGPDTRPWAILSGFVKIPPEATGERSGTRATDRVEMFMNALDRMGERFECTRGHRFRLDEATGILYPVSPDTGPARAYRFRWDEAASDIVLEGLIPPGDIDLELIFPPLEEETEASEAAEPEAKPAEGTPQPPTPETPSEPKPTEPAVQPKPPEATPKPPAPEPKPPAAVTTPTAGASETLPPEVPAPPPAGTGTAAPSKAAEEAPPAENWVELGRIKGSRGRRPDWLIDGRIVGNEISICPIDYVTTEKLTKTVQTLGYLDEVYISEVEPPLPGERVARFKILARLAEEFDYAKKSEML